ncbi:MAG: hypothetical protein ACETWM_17935 [Candidatus Lokiarchaeia archaeon]
MCILNTQTIREMCLNSKPPLIESFEEKQLQGASYDLRLGEEYYKFNADGKKATDMINKIEEYEEITIPPYDVCFVLMKEKVNMPNNLAGRISLGTNLIKQGVMLSVQPPVDPGYSGKIYGMLHNLSKKEVYITKEESVLTIEFIKLNDNTEKIYEGHMKNFKELKQLITVSFESGLSSFVNKTEEDLKIFRNKLYSFVLFYLAIVTVTVTALSVLITVIKY